LRGAYFLRSFYSLEAALDAYYLRLRKLRSRDVRCLMIVAMPKTSSTFLSHILGRLLGWEHSYFASDYYNLEQELYRPRIVDAFGRGTVVQQHFRANTPNLQLLKRYGIRPTVLVRDVFDIVASLRDHLNQERQDNIPSLYVPAEFRTFTPEAQFDFIIRFFGPWLLSFYASWVAAERDGRAELLWIRYEDCLPDYTDVVRRIARHYGVTTTDEAIAAALRNPGQRATRRFNQGVAGRGRSLLSSAQIAELETMARCYPSIDFAPIGIAPIGIAHA
jgi:hypothetical protein